MQRAVIRLALAVGCGLATPVTADDAPLDYDPRILEACLVSRNLDQWDSCIGLASTYCSAFGLGGTSTVGLGYCYDSEYNHWDQILNQTYTELRALDAQSDTEMGDDMPLVPRLAPSLQHMQRQWISYRDAACQYEVAHWGGGTGGGPATAQCLMQLTALQVIALRARVEAYAMPAEGAGQ